MASAIVDDGIDLVGLGRPLAVEWDAAARFLSGTLPALPRWEQTLRVGPGLLGPNSTINLLRMINGFAVQGWYYEQIVRLAKSGEAETRQWPLAAFIANQNRENQTLRAVRAAERLPSD
jgi:hypothetical protein